MNKTLGTTLLVSGTMIGAGMLAMPLTSAGIGFTFTVVLLISLWILLTYSALLFVEVYQTTESDSGIGTLSALYFGNAGRVVSTTVMFVFLYALLAAVCAYGLYAFISRGIWRYLILQQQFFFLDMEKGYAVFFTDYIAIIVLFAAAAHYVAKLMQGKHK